MLRIGTRAAAATGLALMVAGCGSAHWLSIYRTADLGSGTTIITDAKQRVVTNVPAKGGPGRNTPTRIICAEPSPDVAQAVSDAISAAIKVDIAGKGGGAASFGRSTADAVAQLGERLATIQLLRDGLYRACEAYANGAITDTEYSVIISGVDDTMVTLLMGELAAGAFGRASAAIGAAASGAARAGPGIDTDKAQENATAAKDDLDAKEKKLNEEELKLKELRKREEPKPTKEEIAAQEQKVKDAEKERDKAKDRYELALTVFASAGEAATFTSAGAKGLRALGGITAKASAVLAKEIRMMQENFLHRRKMEALIVACISQLGKSPYIDVSMTDEQSKAYKGLGDAITNLSTLLKKSKETTPWSLFSSGTNKAAIAAAERAVVTASQKLGVTTALSVTCMTQLPGILEELAKKTTITEQRVKIEKIKALQGTTEPDSMATIIHPLASFNLHKKDEAALKAQKARLAGKVIPPVSATFLAAARQKLVAEKAALTKIVDALLEQAANALSPSEKAELDRIEDRYITIVTNTGRVGSPSERKVWQADFNLQQANAEAKDKKLKGLSKKLKGASDEVDALVQKIEAVK